MSKIVKIYYKMIYLKNLIELLHINKKNFKFAY